MNRENQRIFTSQVHQNSNLSQSQLRWSSQHNITVSGKQDISALNRLKNVILSLRRDWGSNNSGGIRVEGKEDYEKRLQLAEQEIEGILRKKINCSVNDSEGGERVLDFSNLLNEKENQIVELERKIQNLEARMRKTSFREAELQNYVVNLTEQLKRKDQIIDMKHRSALAEVTNCSLLKQALNKIKKNIEVNRYKLGETERMIMDGVVIPEIGTFDIKVDAFNESTLSARSRVYQQMPDSSKNKTKIVQLFRQFERLVHQQEGFTESEIERIIEGFLSTMNETKLYQKVRNSLDMFALTFEHQRLHENFSVAATIFGDIIAKLKKQNLNTGLPFEIDNLFELLHRDKITAYQVPVGNIFIDMDAKSKVVEVPVQDVRTKHLIHLLTRQFRRIYFKYPKIQGEVDENLAQFLQQEIIDVIEVDEIEKLVQIVKIKHDIIKVENVYTNSTQKQRKKEFHLRVLIKALLEELDKIRIQTGVVLELDEGVIGMVKAEIMDTVNVDDILKVFRINQKIVEVEKVIQKIVERVIEVPKVVTVDKIIEKIVEVEKIKQVQRIVHVPIDKPMIVETEIQKLVPYENKIETIVQVPTIVEKLVELQKQVTKIQEVEVFRDRFIEKEVPVEVERVVNHIQTEVQQIEIFQEKIVPVQKIVEKIIQVPVFVETIVEKIVEVPKIIQVERIVEKIVPQIEYIHATETQHHVEVRYQIVERIVQKIVPVVQIRERIKEVVKEVQVIKQVTNVVTQIKEVEVIRDKLVTQEVIKQVQKIETKVVEVIREVPHEIQKFIEVPIIKEVAVIKEIIIEKPIISRIQSVHIKEVTVKVPLIVKQPVIVEVEKFINVYIEVPKTIKYIEEKIVEVPTIIDRIKEVPVLIEKIIEKMVEVPKVVEVEKIVEKVVVVPRVIEKVVEVPQFIEKIIVKEVIKEKIIEIEKIVQVPVIKQIIKEVQNIKNIYIEIEKPVDRVIQKTVEVPRFEEKIITKQIVKEIPMIIVEEKAVQLQVEKVVPLAYQCIQTVQVDKHIVVPFEIPVPIELVVEKVIPKEEIIQRIIPIPQLMEKIVPVTEYVTQIRQIQKYIEKILIEKEVKEVQKIVPYIQEIIKEVPTIIEKIVTVQRNIDNIVTVERVIEKVIEKTITLPQIYQVERIKEKLVEVPKLIEIEKIVPQIIKVNQYIHKIAEKLIQVPTIIETMKEIVRQQEKVVACREQTTEIVEVERTVERLVYAEKLKEVVRNVNYIEKVLQIVDRFQQIPVSIITTEEKFIEVPFIIEKIVEKIIVMPQIVQVLKYIHEMCQSEDAGVAVDIDVGTHQAKYKELSKNIEKQLDGVLRELRGMKTDNTVKTRIETLEGFLTELRKFILTPRIVKVVQEKLIQSKTPVDKIVRVPVQDEESLKMELSLNVLVEKLISELRRVKQKTGVNLQLDEDIRLIFFNEFDPSVSVEGQLLQKLQNYSGHVNRQFQSLGSWTVDQSMMLKGFLQERFLMAEMIQNNELDREEIKIFTDQQIEQFNKNKRELSTMTGFLQKISAIISENRPVEEIVSVMEEFSRYDCNIQIESMKILGDLMLDNRFQSLIREKDAQISSLRDTILSLQKSRATQSSQEQDMTIRVLKSEIDSLRQQNTLLLAKVSESGLNEALKDQIDQLQARNLELQSEISQLKSENYNILNEKSFVEDFKQHLSFRRAPESSVQQVEARQSGFDRSRYSQSSQNIERPIIPTYTQSVILKPGFEQESTGKKSQAYQQIESRMNTSGNGANLYASPQEQGRGEVGSALYSSVRRQTEHQTSSFTPSSQHQSEVKYDASRFEPGQLGQGAHLTRSGIGQFGVEDSHALRIAQERNTGTSSQYNSRGAQIGSQNIIGQGTQGMSESHSSRKYTGQYGYKPQEEIGSNMGGSNTGSTMQNLFASRGEAPRAVPPTYPTSQTYNQGQFNQSGVTRQVGQGQGGSLQGSHAVQSQGLSLQGSHAVQGQGISLQGSHTVQSQGLSLQGSHAVQGQTTNIQGPQAAQGMNLQSSRSGQTTGMQSTSALRTPIESYKYTSPSPTGVKLTQSIIKQEDSSSRVSAESPQVSQLRQTQGQKSLYQHHYTRPEKKQE